MCPLDRCSRGINHLLQHGAQFPDSHLYSYPKLQVYVVDSCRAKKKLYDPAILSSSLTPSFISRASARQRLGRAGTYTLLHAWLTTDAFVTGRTSDGFCWHLVTREVYGEEAIKMREGGGKEDEETPDGIKTGAVPPHGDAKTTMRAFSLPAIKVEELTSIVLRLVTNGFFDVLDVGSAASKNFWIDEPEKDSVSRALVCQCVVLIIS